MSPIATRVGRLSRSRAGRKAANAAISLARTPKQRRRVIELRSRLSRLH
jgi:hypothetical protein